MTILKMLIVSIWWACHLPTAMTSRQEINKERLCQQPSFVSFAVKFLALLELPLEV
jgi:hypothetical protein